MIPLLAASLLVRAQGGGSVLPKAEPVAVPNEVRDWKGFTYLPAGPRVLPRAIPIAADWSEIKPDPMSNAAVWRTKVVLLERLDRVHERGPEFVWPGHHALTPPTVARIKRGLAQLRALVADATGGKVNLVVDLAEEPEAQTVDGNLADVVRSYLLPRINGGRYEAEDGVFRGPYQSVFVLHPMGGEPSAPFEIAGAPVSVVGLPDVEGQEADGALAATLLDRWREQATARVEAVGTAVVSPPGRAFDWPTVMHGRDATTEERLAGLGLIPDVFTLIIRENPRPWARGPRGADTTVRLVKDPQRGSVLAIEEAGAYRAGGFALPIVEGAPKPSSATTFSFWMKSAAKDPVVVSFKGWGGISPAGSETFSFGIGADVSFTYDDAWHRVKIDIRAVGKGPGLITIGPDEKARASLRQTLGPIVASFSDFELTNDAPDGKPPPETPGPNAVDPEARARWAAAAGPSDARRALMKDPNEAVKANAVAAALARPDPADEPALIEDALYTFEPTIFTPALRALAKLKTPTADAALKQALRIAAADRARGLAAEILAESGDPKVVPLLVGLNQSRTRAARLSAILALGHISGSEAALMRMAYLAQDDPEIKLEATRTADPNDDYQARKLLWSAINEPSDAVRLESLRRLSSSTVPEFQTEGLKGIRDDSIGVRIGLLQAWTDAPSARTLAAIRASLTDRAPRVRAAAVAALTSNPETVDPRILPFSDADPGVQLALVALTKAKGIVFPDDARAAYKKSPDARVRAAVGG